ncbi:MAG: flagellin lysine-N-methylase [Lachnospiraceae bacterium]|nr:flagellin lysine-N-methylase [Lachnospiraceae bacterium]
MLYTYPDYYKEFKCIADKCQDTCCAGWQIVIDDEALKKYKAVPDNHPFKERLSKSVDWKEKIFNRDKERRCLFLNDNNLCDLYTALGEESLCKTCTRYPRHIEELEEIREVSLSISCPEVARIILSKKEPVSFWSEETDENEYFEVPDYLLQGILLDARDVIIGILQDRSIDITLRLAYVWQMAVDIQDALDEGMTFTCQDILEEYSAKLPKTRVKQKIKRFFNNKKRHYKTSLKMFRMLYRLELLNEEWAVRTDDGALTLYGRDEEDYTELSDEFDRWLVENMPNWQIQIEQVAVYFIFTYMCGAAYDGELASKVKMSVAAVFYIRELLMAQWANNGRNITFQDIVDVTYKFSRELEHSDINLEELEACMNEI